MKIAVAKDGVDAKTSTNPNDFIFHSDYNTLKIIKRSTTFPTWADTGGVEVTKTVAHGLSYTPFVFAFGRFSGSQTGLPGTRDTVADFTWTRMTVDATNITFYAIYSGGGNYQLPITYFCVEIPL